MDGIPKDSECSGFAEELEMGQRTGNSAIPKAFGLEAATQKYAVSRHKSHREKYDSALPGGTQGSVYQSSPAVRLADATVL